VHPAVSHVAEDGLYVVAVVALVVWLLVPRPAKVEMAVEMVVGLVTVAILVKVAGAVHTDPRPFVANPAIHPWFSHAPDNGFPSDHTAVAAMTSFVVLLQRRTVGCLLLVLSALIAAARVTAHVHHVQDVVAGGVIGLVAALVGVLVWRAVDGTPAARRAAGQSLQTRPTSEVS